MKQKQNPVRVFVKTLLWLCLAGFSFVAGGEIILRVFYFGPDALIHFRRYEPVVTVNPWYLVLSDNDRIAVEPRPNYQWYYLGKQVRTNSLGIVDDRESIEKKEGAKTIVMMGESYMEGSGVDLSERVTALLESKLRRRGDYSVVNMALTNTVLESQIERLKTTVIPNYHPDVVLVAFVAQGNIAGNVLPQAAWTQRVETGSDHYPLWKVSFFLFMLHDYAENFQLTPDWFLKKGMKVFGAGRKSEQARVTQKTDSSEVLDNAFEGDPNLIRVRALFSELAKLGEQNQFQTVIVPVSLMKDFKIKNRLAYWRDLSKSVADEFHFPTIETIPFFEDKDVRACILWAMNRHPNAYANEIFAEGIYQGLLDQKILPTEYNHNSN